MKQIKVHTAKLKPNKIEYCNCGSCLAPKSNCRICDINLHALLSKRRKIVYWMSPDKSPSVDRYYCSKRCVQMGIFQNI